jgi:protein Tex
MLNERLIDRVAAELNIAPRQARAALALFEEGSTVPFVARYRKEVTGGLDDLQLRDLEERATYLEELEERRTAILASIEEQGKLDDALRARIDAAETKQALEDLYLPYKPKRRTRATIAKERGLEPLADLIWNGASDADVLAQAHAYVRPDLEVNTIDDALRGARDILAERFAEDADKRGFVRDYTHRNGTIVSTGKKGVDKATSKFADYFEFSQKLADIPSHRILAIRRAEAEEQVTWQINVPVDDVVAQLQRRILSGRNAHQQLSLVAEDAYKRLLAPSIEVELRLELKQRADEDAITIFGSNLEQLLLGAPAGERVVLGLDPGFRTGVKAAIVSRTGALQNTNTLYLHQEDRFKEQVRALVQQHGVELIAIGNGTASRETEALTRAVVREMPEPRPQVVVVNEAGASVYSASDVARDEFPELDVSLRGAPSIARRLQDPLAELVKIDPKSIGVGQYQHDVNQSRLKKRLDDVVETCVNKVGVEVNTASPSLLSYVAGLGPMLAKNVVEFRDKRGGIRSREELLEVPRLGAKAFEQAAGFLRVRGATHPLDATAVHPERYELVETMARDLGVDVKQLIANDELIERIELKRYISHDIGLPTLQDIIAELRKPGRDPRDTFEPPQYRDDVKEPKDLQPGMELEGVVTNLVAFGAFVDIGVHQDGLVHVSQLADKFVKDPAEVVRVGQKVKVTVVSLDLDRNRIALSMRKQQQPAAPAGPRVEKKREPKASIPTKGTVAPNGMRFK